MATKDKTREQWLQQCTRALKPYFKRKGYEIPDVHISVGFPKGARGRSKAIGQCFSGKCSTDGVSHIFITPEHGPDKVLDVQGVMETLVHELGHAIVGTDCGHKGPFKQYVSDIGLTGKCTATQMEKGGELYNECLKVVERIGDYPHATLKPGSIKKQSTRLLKVVCPECGYTARITRKWLEETGAPYCPCLPEDMLEMVQEV